MEFNVARHLTLTRHQLIQYTKIRLTKISQVSTLALAQITRIDRTRSHPHQILLAGSEFRFAQAKTWQFPLLLVDATSVPTLESYSPTHTSNPMQSWSNSLEKSQIHTIEDARFRIPCPENPNIFRNFLIDYHFHLSVVPNLIAGAS